MQSSPDNSRHCNKLFLCLLFQHRYQLKAYKAELDHGGMSESHSSTDTRRTLRLQLQPGMHSKYATFDDLHTRVTLHHTRIGARGKKTWKEELKGSINDIFTTKVEGQFPTRILLLGEAGRGKTTAVAKLAHDWAMKAEKSPLRDVPLVFLVKFRDTDQTWSLGEAIVSGPLAHLKGVKAEEIEKFIIENEEDCFILLDGYDEFSGSMKSLDSMTSLFELLLFQRFTKCRILVTCRPYLANHFEMRDLSKVYAKMEVEGFADNDAKQYISNYFRKSAGESAKLSAYLSERYDIESLVKVPFLCMTLCTLWEGHYLKNTETLTKVFECILLYLQEHAKVRPFSSQQSHPFDFSEGNVRRVIITVGKVAFESLISDKNRLLLSRREFEQNKSLEELELAIEMGLVNTFTRESRELFKPPETFVEFHHKLAQEHCAGFYMANLQLQDLKSVLSKLQHREQIFGFANVLQFAAGSNAEVCLPILQHLLDVKSSDIDEEDEEGEGQENDEEDQDDDAEDDKEDEEEREEDIDYQRLILMIIGESACDKSVIASPLPSFFKSRSLRMRDITPTMMSGFEKFPCILKSKVRKIQFILQCNDHNV